MWVIAKDIYEPLINSSLSFKYMIDSSDIEFHLSNRSKVETEVHGKVWAKTEYGTFEFKKGFYGNMAPWIVQPHTDVHGFFNLNNLENKAGEKLESFVRNKKIESITFSIQLKYRRTGTTKWRKNSPQRYFFKFGLNDQQFWLDVEG